MQALQRALLNALARLPLAVLHALSSMLAWAAFHLVRWRRALVLNNLSQAFPEQPEPALQGVMLW